MAVRGTKPKPIEQHKRAGTYRADRHGANLAVVEPLNGVLPSPTPAAALAQLLDEGVAWLGRTDTPALLLLQELLSEREGLRAQVDAGVEGARRHLRDLDKQVIGLLGNLGFDPASRARLGLAEVKTQSKLEELRAKQAR